MRHTRAHTGNRRSHHALTGPRLSKCANCAAEHLRHRVCLSCGHYRGKMIIDVAAAAKKLADKKKAKSATAK
ncbi:MAG: 50S ribosomal protein L32 [Patescibacteria group bacterium]